MRVSFDTWLRLKEGLGFNMNSPEAEKAVTYLMTRYHGWPEENIKAELLKPGFNIVLMKKFGLDPHGEPYDVIQTVGQQLGIPIPKMLG